MGSWMIARSNSRTPSSTAVSSNRDALYFSEARAGLSVFSDEYSSSMM